MKHRLIRGAAALAGWMLFASVHAGDPTRTFSVRNLDPMDAISMVQVRVPNARAECRLMPQHTRDPRSSGAVGVILAECKSEAMFPKIEAAIAAIDVPPPTYRFHVALLSASRKDGAMPDLPPGEAKALNDFKKVMTYKSFKIEAETVLQGSREMQTTLNGEYRLEMGVDDSSTDSILVKPFQLQPVTPKLLSTGKQVSTTLIETSFNIMRGETIVLGTSISDQQAAVVLVTALP
jgi:hypothetical protein